MERITDREFAYVTEVLRSQFRTSASGMMTKRLEEQFAELIGVKYAISHVNGTATMHAGLAAAGVGSGDEVIVPPLTMASTAFAALHAGAVPIFADVDPDTFTIDPGDIQKRITPRTRAIITVALFGLAPDMDAIMEVANAHDLIVVEDDAECFLGRYKGRVVGSIGHMASFSFQSSKHMTCGEGGMLVTDDEQLANNVRRFSNLGYAVVSGSPGKGKITKDTIQDPDYDRHASVGWNYRMSDLCAAVALAQLERLSELVRQRVRVARLYEEAVRGCKWLVPQSVPHGYEHSYWTYALKLENGSRFSWHDFRNKYIESGGDGFYAAWKLNYMEPAFRQPQDSFQRAPQEYGPGLCPVAESIQPTLVQLKTNYMDMTVAEQKAEALAKTIRYFGA